MQRVEICNVGPFSGPLHFALTCCQCLGHILMKVHSWKKRCLEFSFKVWGVSLPWPSKFVLFPKPLSYYFCLMTRCTIIMGKALFFTKLFLDGLENVFFFYYYSWFYSSATFWGSPFPCNLTHEESQDAILLAWHSWCTIYSLLQPSSSLLSRTYNAIYSE